MKSLTKMLKSLSSPQVLMVIAAVALIYALCSYSMGKGRDGMMLPAALGNQQNTPADRIRGQKIAGAAVMSNNPVAPAQPSGQNEQPAKVNGGSRPVGIPSSCTRAPVDNPASLLPSDANSQWAALNPSGSGDLANVNLLSAGFHTGIDTIGSSLRNANLQLRSEPANPQLNVGPWNNTTIEPDTRAQNFELGNCGGM